jgi:hypothetical protein
LFGLIEVTVGTVVWLIENRQLQTLIVLPPADSTRGWYALLPGAAAARL